MQVEDVRSILDHNYGLNTYQAIAQLSEARQATRDVAGTAVSGPGTLATSSGQHSTSSQHPQAESLRAAALTPADTFAKHLQELTLSRGTRVLGAATLSLLHSNATRTELPSWVSPAPTGFGTKTRGKLSADQWRTLCTIHLPITLIPLWSNSSSTRLREVLTNFMDLVSAVNIGGQLQISESDLQLYDHYILEYVTGFKRLYKEASIKSNHHLAVHLTRFLRMFGPVHSW